MKELSVFIDESGSFGEYDRQSPYYIIAMVFHDQSISINDSVIKLDQELYVPSPIRNGRGQNRTVGIKRVEKRPQLLPIDNN